MQTQTLLVMCVTAPPIMSFANRNTHNLKEFFANINRDGLVIAWEPRGDWIRRSQEIRSACEQLELVRCVDLLRRDPVHLTESGCSDCVAWARRSTTTRIGTLIRICWSCSTGSRRCLARNWNACVMFNNTTMLQDERRFLTHFRALSE